MAAHKASQQGIIAHMKLKHENELTAIKLECKDKLAAMKKKYEQKIERMNRKIAGLEEKISVEVPSSDEDSAFMYVIKEMTVEGAGLREINGTYRRCGGNDGVSKYVRPSRYNGRLVNFMLFRCKLNDGTRRWYISIVPADVNPGTIQDIDFYAAQLSPGVVDHSIPPRDGWIAIPSNGGASPPPTVYPKESNS
jgi:hypothetical protein